MAAIRPAPATPYVHQDYPRFVYDPETGASIVAKSESGVPDGWLTFPPGDPRAEVAVPLQAEPPAGADAPDAQPTPPADESGPEAVSDVPSRDEVIAALRLKGLKFNSRASTSALWELLKD
jgi:hypothetical protein